MFSYLYLSACLRSVAKEKACVDKDEEDGWMRGSVRGQRSVWNAAKRGGKTSAVLLRGEESSDEEQVSTSGDGVRICGEKLLIKHGF